MSLASPPLASCAPSVEALPPKLLGRTMPRVFTPPLAVGPAGPCGCGCALDGETSLGFEVDAFARDLLGIVLLPWERWLLIHALERVDGRFRFRTLVLLVARQNGKSTVMQILSLWMMYVWGAGLVIGTAQDLDTAEEQWEGAVELADAVPELKAEVAQVLRVNGKKQLKLRTGERYKVRAASRRGGRGLSGDLILLDEIREHQSWDAWAAVTKTTMARDDALVWAASNAGDAASVVLRYLRKMAHGQLGDPDGLAAGETVQLGDDVEGLGPDDTLAIFEWSATPGCSVSDRAGWAQANPSLGYTISERAVAAAARTDPEWVFRTEVLCQWMDSTADGPFPTGAWEACRIGQADAPVDVEFAWCVDVSWDRSTTHIGVAGVGTDGRPYVEVVASRVGTDWTVGWFTDPDHPDRMARPAAVQARRSPASDLVVPLRDAGVDVVEWDGVAGTGELYDHVRAANGDGDSRTLLAHIGQPLLDAAAANAVSRPVGDAWAWDRRKSSVDVAPLVAVTGALWCATRTDKKPKRTGRVW